VIADVAGGCVIVVGVGALAGWAYAVPFLTNPFHAAVQMKADTAVGFIALGMSLLLTPLHPRGTRALAPRALALLPIVIGTLTVAEYVSGHNLGLDQLLFSDPRALSSAHPGRLAPETAFVFVLLGVALWVLNGSRAARSHLPRALNGISSAVAIFAVIGYSYRISGFDRFGTLTPIALYSALTFILLCLGIAAKDPNGPFEQLLRSEASGVVAAKRLLPITVAVFPVLGWLQIKGRDAGLYAPETGVALMVLLSTAILFLAVLSLTKRLSLLDVERRIGIEREARLATLVDATTDAILSYDTDGIITSWNRAAQALYGYRETEVIGRRIDLLSPPALVGEQRRMLKAVAAGHAHIDFDLTSLHKNGSVLDTSVTISRIMHGSQLIGFCSVSRDIADRIRARDELERRVLERTEDLNNSRTETLQRLALAAEYRDDDTAQHTERVGKGALRLAEDLHLPPTLLRSIEQAASLHDVGKIAISDKLLFKPGPLTAQELEAMKQHTILGARLLAGSGSEVLQLGEQIALTHHERWDGSGYPKGLIGNEIPIAGRIVAVVDTFDAMTNDRPYHPARTADQALAEIKRCSGSLFDPEITAAFLRQHEPPADNDHLHKGPEASLASIAPPQRMIAEVNPPRAAQIA
jgi:PAS domain S-box-containing protein